MNGGEQIDVKCTLEVQRAGLADRFGEVPEGGIGNRFLA